MSDFLTRQAGRLLGVAPIVQPVIASRFAQGPELLSDTSGDWLEQVAPAPVSPVAIPRMSSPAAPEAVLSVTEGDGSTFPHLGTDGLSSPAPDSLDQVVTGNMPEVDPQGRAVTPGPVEDLSPITDALSQEESSPLEIDAPDRIISETYEYPLLEEPITSQTLPESTVESAFGSEAPANNSSYGNDRPVVEADMRGQSRTKMTMGLSREVPEQSDYPREPVHQETPRGIPEDDATRPSSMPEVATSLQVGRPAPGELSPQPPPYVCCRVFIGSSNCQAKAASGRCVPGREYAALSSPGPAGRNLFPGC
jgi:hypothetical protein